MIPLGPFDLIRPIGRGGSCEVWRGVHREAGLPVAVKVVFGKKARAPRFISSFREEVRAVAGLNHPSIVMVFDYGLLPAEAAALSNGKLSEGAPYLVMELGQDTLHAYCDRLPWPRIYRILLSLLDGLAHAHARGVIHRDIKPANILVCEDRQVKLSDFGLAHGVEHTEAPRHSREILGTPSYMAPEQFELRWRDYGPWTDLYALGCTTYTLLCGFPPFGRTAQLEDMMAAHLYQPIPALPPRLPVPAGFERWLKQLLQKDPEKRFLSAADAAWSLMQLQQNARPTCEEEPQDDWEDPARTSPFAPRVTMGDDGIVESLDEPSLHTLQSLVGGTPTPSVLPAVTDAIQRSFAAQESKQPGLSTQLPLVDVEPSLQAEAPATEDDLPASFQGDARMVTHLASQDSRSVFAHPPTFGDDEAAPLRPFAQRPPTAHADDPFLEPEFDSLAEETINHPPDLPAFPTSRVWQVEQTLEHDGPIVLDVDKLSATAKASRQRFTRLSAGSQPSLEEIPVVAGTASGLLDRPLFGTFVPAERGSRPPFPETWRRKALTERSRLLDDVGLGLYGLRTVPLVAREAERDQLWESLAQVMLGNEACLVSLTGSSGSGKSRLAQWLCERASEVGAAQILKSVHSPISGPSDGFGAMLSRYLRCAGLRRDQILARIEAGLDDRSSIAIEECRALTELIVPAARHKEDAPIEPTIRFGNPTERYEVVRKFIERLCRRRPVILWLDDIHWSPDSLSFVSYVMESQRWRPIPLLILTTSRSEVLAERKVRRSMHEEMIAHPRAQLMEVGPLTSEENSALVRELLGLRGELALQVEQRTAGNPLFAVQLVGDWVQRGLLVRSARGFRLAPGVQIEIPDDLHHVWIDRLEQVLETRPDHDWIALELAATLGIEVVRDEWAAVCELASVPVPDDLLDTLFELRLAQAAQDSGASNWSFAHSMLRESLERRAREGDRWAHHHAICAQMLQRQADGQGGAERLGRHLQLAGDLKGSLAPLLKGIWEHVDAGDYRLAEILFSDWKTTLTQLSLPPSNSFWGEAWLLRSRMARVVGEYDQGGRLATMLVKDARTHGWDRILIYALLEQANCGWRIGVDEDEVWLRLEEAEERACQRGKPKLEAECRRYMGNFLCNRGKLDEAARHLRTAYAIFESISDNIGMARCCFGLSNVERQAGRYSAARGHVKRAQKRYEASGIRRGIVDCLNSLGDLARFEGDLAQSETYYRDSLERYEALGAGDTSISRLNISLVLLHRQRYDEAQAILEESIVQLNERGQKDLEGIAHLCMLPVMAADERWDAWQHHYTLAHHMLEETGLCDVDSARVAELAGDVALAAGRPQFAKDAFVLAIEQWRSLGRDVEIKALEQRIQGYLSPS